MALYHIHVGGGGPPTRAPGLLTRIGIGITAALILAGSLFLGAIIFVAVATVAVIGSLAFYLRFWWFKRQIEKAMRNQPPPDQSAHHRPTDPDVIDVEYTEKDA